MNCVHRRVQSLLEHPKMLETKTVFNLMGLNKKPHTIFSTLRDFQDYDIVVIDKSTNDLLDITVGPNRTLTILGIDKSIEVNIKLNLNESSKIHLQNISLFNENIMIECKSGSEIHINNCSINTKKICENSCFGVKINIYNSVINSFIINNSMCESMNLELVKGNWNINGLINELIIKKCVGGNVQVSSGTTNIYYSENLHLQFIGGSSTEEEENRLLIQRRYSDSTLEEKVIQRPRRYSVGQEDDEATGSCESYSHNIFKLNIFNSLISSMFLKSDVIVEGDIKQSFIKQVNAREGSLLKFYYCSIDHISARSSECEIQTFASCIGKVHIKESSIRIFDSPVIGCIKGKNANIFVQKCSYWEPEEYALDIEGGNLTLNECSFLTDDSYEQIKIKKVNLTLINSLIDPNLSLQDSVMMKNIKSNFLKTVTFEDQRGIIRPWNKNVIITQPKSQILVGIEGDAFDESQKIMITNVSKEASMVDTRDIKLTIDDDMTLGILYTKGKWVII